MDYLKLLEHSFDVAQNDECPPDSRMEFLGEHIFNFTTYDGEMSALFAGHAIEVCRAITGKQTFEFIRDPEQYRWYLLMCNMSFFADKLEWGTSIRGAWWHHEPIQLRTCGLWIGDEQLVDPVFSQEEWREFIAALLSFSATPSTGARDG